MRFGAFWQVPGFVGSSVPRRHWETIEQIALADKLGFETAWIAESVFFPGRPLSNPLMVASAAGQHTSRIRFGTLAAQFPLHHPIHMATQAATCDILTNGRLDLCLGGRWGSPAGQAFGQAKDISATESRGRVSEGIELLRAAWTQEKASFEGDYWSMNELLVEPKPLQEPYPPLLLAANSDETFSYAASMGLGVIGTTLSQPMPRMIDRLREFEGGEARRRREPSTGISRQHIVLRRRDAQEGARDDGSELARRRHSELGAGRDGVVCRNEQAQLHQRCRRLGNVELRGRRSVLGL